ncbi:MAG: hypothetical protein A2Y56_07660 [Candidatus Aminicenantes bacterium RBG_13_63_10]|nr:MAG: hypothetical protein A2Y56_07660 [Candidatus Aminicenantes bacterium RBG_13_63_10]
MKSLSSELCLACGLCCRGVFFVNTIDPENYGLAPPRRSLPPGSPAPPRCLLHVENRCLIYDDPRKPVFCSDWKCLLLKQLLNEAVTFASAKRVVSQVVHLYERVATILRPVCAKPVLKLALEAWENRKEEMSSGRLNGAQLLDICSFLLLVDRHLKPYKPGLFENGGKPPRA